MKKFMKILIRLIKFIICPILIILSPVEFVIWGLIWVITGKFIEYPLFFAIFFGMDEYIQK